MRPVHGTRRGPFEVHALPVIAAAGARPFEFVFAGLPVRRAAKISAACAAGRAAEAVAGAGAAASGVAGSPSSAVTSASFSAGNPLRLRRACSAATTERLHFFPAATIVATSGLIAWLAPLVAAAGGG